VFRSILLTFFFAAFCFAQKYYTYIGNVAADSVLIAWGTTDGVNTIGRSSPSHGEATVRIAGRILTSSQNWIVVGDLKPDTDYTYEIQLHNSVIGNGTVRTWPSNSTRLAFFVIGDYGTGNGAQHQIAQAMLAEFRKREHSGNPPRFVITTGDNIYGDFSTTFFGVRHTGSADSDWTNKFFEPYRELISHIPFYPTLGNHDGNESENRTDLSAYLDNFFFPGDKPARYYEFSYAGFADFFALDSTLITESGPMRAQYLENGPEFAWMKKVLPASKAMWKIPYYHHPVFNAGPRHVSSHHDLQHWIDLFASSGVKVVFNGHEHNFQFSEVDDLSGGVRYITSGAGGELRPGNVQSHMRKENVAGWASQNHFLLVEIDGKTMNVTPISWEPMNVTDPDGKTIQMPIVVKLP
jgi:tartrate-resistant acid phosphatase type 5